MIKIEKFTKIDIPTLLTLLAGTDKKFLYQFAGPRYNYPLDVEQLNSTLKLEDSLLFKVLSVDNEETIGHFQFMRVNHQYKSSSVGRIYISPTYRGKGYGSELVKQIIEYGKNELKLSVLHLRVFAFNNSAVKCYKKLGFKETDREENFIDRFKETWESIIMEYNC